MVHAKKYVKIAVLSALIASFLALGVRLRLVNLNNVAARSPDEMVYAYQARTVYENGLDGIRMLIEEYNTREGARLYPPPARLSNFLLVASCMRWTNVVDEKAGAYVSFAFSIISLFLLVIAGLRFL